MHVLVFSKPNNDAKTRLIVEISQIPGIAPKIIQNHRNFARILKSGHTHYQAIVFLAGDRKDLDMAVSLHRYLSLSQLILILPNKNTETVNQALALNPGVLAFSDGNFKKSISILAKMATLESHDPEYITD